MFQKPERRKPVLALGTVRLLHVDADRFPARIERDALQEHLFGQACSMFGLGATITLYDLTNTSESRSTSWKRSSSPA